MQHTKIDDKEMSTIKCKNIDMYSEFNNYPYTEQCVFTQTDELISTIEYSKQKEIISYDEYSKIGKNASFIDLYIQGSNKDIYLYDTKHKCIYNGFNTAHTQNCYYNYSGTDVNRLLVFMEYTNNSMQRLLKDLKTSTLQVTPDLSTLILVIDSKKIKDFFNVEEYTKQQSFLIGDFNYQAEDTAVLFSNVTQNSFDIIIEQQCIGFRISVCKYSFRNLLDTLAAVCNLSRYSLPIYEFKVPSLWVGTWYFRNITQGHLLRVLLMNVNVNSLNVMRKFYFVVITETARNFIIQINFVLRNGVFRVYEEESFNLFPGPVNWNYKHRNILQKSSSMDTWNILKKKCENRKTLNSLNAITYTKSALNDFPIRKFQYEYEDSLQTEYDDDTSIPYSDLDSNRIKSDITINLTVNKSVGTSFVFHIDEITGKNINNFKKSATTLCNFKIESDSNMTLLAYSRVWLTKLLHGSKLISTCLNLHPKHDYINETMFDTSSLDLYVKYVHKYWKRFICQTFYKDFFKCLAQSLIYTLFSYEI